MAEKETKKPAPVQVPAGNATTLRIGAVILWLAGIALEVVALLVMTNKIKTQGAMFWVLGIGALVLDLVCVIIGSTLWKKSNRIDPASEKNKVKFWLWNNMGLIASVLAFLPFIILLLTSKDADGKAKKVGTIVAVIALLIGGLLSYDFDPVSKEGLEAAQNAYNGRQVVWSVNSKVYHSREDCTFVNRMKEENRKTGTVTEAFEADKTRVCKVCAANDAKEGVDLTGVPVQDDEVVTNDLDAELEDLADNLPMEDLKVVDPAA